VSQQNTTVLVTWQANLLPIEYLTPGHRAILSIGLDFPSGAEAERVVLLAGHDASFQSSLRCEGASQYPPSLVQLGLGVAARAVEHRGNFAVIETVNVVKEEDAAITGRHTGDSPIDSQTVNDAGLCQVASANFVRRVLRERFPSGDRGKQQPARACAGALARCSQPTGATMC